MAGDTACIHHTHTHTLEAIGTKKANAMKATMQYRTTVQADSSTPAAHPHEHEPVEPLTHNSINASLCGWFREPLMLWLGRQASSPHPHTRHYEYEIMIIGERGSAMTLRESDESDL